MKCIKWPLLGLSLGFMACATDQASQHNSDGEFPTFSISEKIVVEPAEALAEVDFIPLKFPEGTPMSLVGFDPNITFTDSKIFLNTDPYMNPFIHEFDYQGNHIQTINRRGGGPNEYPSIEKIGTTLDGRLVVSSQGNLLVFDEELNIEKRINARPENGFYSIQGFYPLNESDWLFGVRGGQNTSTKRPNFAIFNAESLEYEFLDLKAYPASGVAEDASIAPYRDGFLFSFGLSDTIYYYDRNQITPFIAINSGRRALPTAKKMQDEDDMEDELRQMIATQPYDINMGVVVTSEKTIATLIFGVKPMPIDIDFDEMEEEPEDLPMYEVYLNPETQAAKATRIMPGIGGVFFSDGEYFYRLLYTEVWNHLLETEKLGPTFTRALQAAADALMDEEDPIIMRYKIKW